MTLSAILAAYRRQLLQYGEPVTLLRPATETDAETRLANVRARVRAFLAHVVERLNASTR